MAVLTALSAIFGRLRGVAQGVELADLVRHLWPQLLKGQQFAFIASVSDEFTCSADRTRPVSASRTTYTVSLPFSGWTPSTETMMPPFFSTCLSHCWSSLASLLARKSVQ